MDQTIITDDDLCAVCLSKLRQEYKLECGHVFCYDCIFKIVVSPQCENKCPLCRNEIRLNIIDESDDKDLSLIIVNSQYNNTKCIRVSTMIIFTFITVIIALVTVFLIHE